MKTQTKDCFECGISKREHQKVFVKIDETLLCYLVEAGCLDEKNKYENEFGKSYWKTGNFSLTKLANKSELTDREKETIVQHEELMEKMFGLPYYQTITLVPTEEKGLYEIVVKIIADYVPMQYIEEKEIAAKMKLFETMFQRFQQNDIVNKYRLKMIFNQSEEDLIDNMMAEIQDNSEGIKEWMSFLTHLVTQEMKKILLNKEVDGAENFRRHFDDKTPDIY